MRERQGEGGVIGIYLAAGSSRRMGCNKLSLPVGGVPLGSIALRGAVRSALDEVLVVTREEDSLEWIASDLSASPLRARWRSVPCADAEQGQAHSLHCGLREAMRKHARAVMVLLADQPLVTEHVIDRLLQHDVFRREQAAGWGSIAASRRGVPMPPVLFESSLFPALLMLQGDEGARKILRAEGSAVRKVAFEEAVFLDVDTPDMLERFRNGDD